VVTAELPGGRISIGMAVKAITRAMTGIVNES
jgi:hypothetical protein